MELRQLQRWGGGGGGTTAGQREGPPPTWQSPARAGGEEGGLPPPGAELGPSVPPTLLPALLVTLVGGVSGSPRAGPLSCVVAHPGPWSRQSPAGLLANLPYPPPHLRWLPHKAAETPANMGEGKAMTLAWRAGLTVSGHGLGHKLSL